MKFNLEQFFKYLKVGSNASLLIATWYLVVFLWDASPIITRVRQLVDGSEQLIELLDRRQRIYDAVQIIETDRGVYRDIDSLQRIVYDSITPKINALIGGKYPYDSIVVIYPSGIKRIYQSNDRAVRRWYNGFWPQN